MCLYVCVCVCVCASVCIRSVWVVWYAFVVYIHKCCIYDGRLAPIEERCSAAATDQEERLSCSRVVDCPPSRMRRLMSRWFSILHFISSCQSERCWRRTRRYHFYCGYYDTAADVVVVGGGAVVAATPPPVCIAAAGASDVDATNEVVVDVAEKRGGVRMNWRACSCSCNCANDAVWDGSKSAPLKDAGLGRFSASETFGWLLCVWKRCFEPSIFWFRRRSSSSVGCWDSAFVLNIFCR